jgi:ABC-type transport system substrate-binding protein
MTTNDHWNNIETGKTDIWWLGAGLLYNDPAYLINALFSNKIDGLYNYQRTNDSIVQSWMEQGLIETDPVLRNLIYYNIQKRLIEELYPVTWLYSPVWYDVYRSNLRGWGIGGAGWFKYLYFL